MYFVPSLVASNWSATSPVYHPQLKVGTIVNVNASGDQYKIVSERAQPVRFASVRNPPGIGSKGVHKLPWIPTIPTLTISHVIKLQLYVKNAELRCYRFAILKIDPMNLARAQFIEPDYLTMALIYQHLYERKEIPSWNEIIARKNLESDINPIPILPPLYYKWLEIEENVSHRHSLSKMPSSASVA
jgi:hypothetical protein